MPHLLHLLRSKLPESPSFDSPLGTPVEASKQKVTNFPPRRWFPLFISFAPLSPLRVLAETDTIPVVRRVLARS
jgi:hypothetical protein